MFFTWIPQKSNEEANCSWLEHHPNKLLFLYRAKLHSLWVPHESHDIRHLLHMGSSLFSPIVCGYPINFVAVVFFIFNHHTRMVCDLVSLNSSQQFSSERKKMNQRWTPAYLYIEVTKQPKLWAFTKTLTYQLISDIFYYKTAKRKLTFFQKTLDQRWPTSKIRRQRASV